MGSDPTPPAKRRRCHKKALSPRLAKLDKEFEEAGGEWREYHLVELFGKSTRGKRLKSSDRVCGTLPFVTAGEENTGISAYIGNDVEIFRANSITIDMFGSAKFRGYDFGADDHVAVVHTEHLSKAVCQFVTVAIHKSSYSGKFSYSRNFYAKDADELVISLPTINNNLAFSYMENYIKTLEAERIETLEAYLTVTGLKDYHLTKNDEKILDRFTKLTDTESRVEYLGTYTLSDLFYLNSSKRKYNANSIEFGGEFPYVARGESNNGIRGYITEPEEFLNPAGSISFGQDTATMFYQKEAYFTGDKIKILQAKDIELDRFIGQYMITAMRKSFSTFSWGSSSFNETVLKNVEISLPTKNKQPDYTFMSDFIKVIEKLVIKDLVEWTDKKIQATKEVVAER